VAQTLVEIWSGIATAARAIVDAATAVSPDVVVACTRKNVPGTKSYAVRAVRAGGAVMHRLGLSETVLVFPEHRAFLGDEPLRETVRRLRRAAPEKSW
jgi:molybdenum transport protein